MSEHELLLKQVEKVANSGVLHGSESLRKLLRYLAHHAIEHPGTPLKEYQIATEELGRAPDFDPAVDSMKILSGLNWPRGLTPFPSITGSLENRTLK
jgi:hypothetical protein